MPQITQLARPQIRIKRQHDSKRCQGLLRAKQFGGNETSNLKGAQLLQGPGSRFFHPFLAAFTSGQFSLLGVGQLGYSMFAFWRAHVSVYCDPPVPNKCSPKASTAQSSWSIELNRADREPILLLSEQKVRNVSQKLL